MKKKNGRRTKNRHKDKKTIKQKDKKTNGQKQKTSQEL